MILAPQPIKSEKCLRCSHTLTNPVSMYVGFGPICSEYLGIKRPEYEDLMKLNPEDNEQLDKLLAARQKLEAANNIEGSVTLENDQVIIKFPWNCQDFGAIKSTVKQYAAKWNPQKKHWEVSKLQLPNLLPLLKEFPNIAIDEDLFSISPVLPLPCLTDKPICLSVGLIKASTNRGIDEYKGQNICLSVGLVNASIDRGIDEYKGQNISKLESLAAQMKKRLETVDITNITLKNGLQLFLKRENGTYKVFCARENVLPSKVEVKVIGDSFFGKGRWEYGKAKTVHPLPTKGYVIHPVR